MAAPVLRALRGLQVVRWQLMSTRPFQSQRASQARDGKTLVSFPAKVSFPARVSDGSKDSVKGEDIYQTAPPLDEIVGRAPGKNLGSERAVHIGPGASLRDMRGEGSTAKREDEPSSSSSSSSSDSDSEEEEPAPGGSIPTEPKDASGGHGGDVGGPRPLPERGSLPTPGGQSREEPRSSPAPQGTKASEEEIHDGMAPVDGAPRAPQPGKEPVKPTPAATLTSQEEGQKSPAEVSPLPEREGQIEEPPVSDGVGEQAGPPLSAEAPIPTESAPEETPPGPTEELAGPPAPETPAADQPFDNSRYQNLQHHSYDPFTFVDYDVELVRFRLPQPSAGRPSPRH